MTEEQYQEKHTAYLGVLIEQQLNKLLRVYGIEEVQHGKV